MIKSDDILLFVQVVDEGSFSKVAEKLSITNSVVSKRIGRLEEALRVQLLYRTTRKLNLTDAGRALYGKARLAKLAFQDATEAVTGYGDEMSGTIKVTMPIVTANLVLSDATLKFCMQYPNINVDLYINNRIVDLIGEGFDLAIRTGYLEDSSMVARRLIDSNWVVCATTRYLNKHSEPRHPFELNDHQCLIYCYESSGPQSWSFIIDGEEKYLNVQGRFKANDLGTLRQAVLAGLGIAFLPKALIFKDLRDRNLVPLLSEFQGKQMGMYAIYPRSRQPDKKLKLLVEHYRSALHKRRVYYN